MILLWWEDESRLHAASVVATRCQVESDHRHLVGFWQRFSLVFNSFSSKERSSRSSLQENGIEWAFNIQRFPSYVGCIWLYLAVLRISSYFYRLDLLCASQESSHDRQDHSIEWVHKWVHEGTRWKPANRKSSEVCAIWHQKILNNWQTYISSKNQLWHNHVTMSYQETSGLAIQASA